MICFRVLGQIQKQKQKVIVSLINTMCKTNGIQNWYKSFKKKLSYSNKLMDTQPSYTYLSHM